MDFYISILNESLQKTDLCNQKYSLGLYKNCRSILTRTSVYDTISLILISIGRMFFNKIRILFIKHGGMIYGY